MKRHVRVVGMRFGMDTRELTLYGAAVGLGRRRLRARRARGGNSGGKAGNAETGARSSHREQRYQSAERKLSA